MYCLAYNIAVIPHKKVARIYTTRGGREPFSEWLDDLKDIRGKAAVLTRVRRMEEGNPGHCRSVGQGVQELKIDCGPGYRVYFGLDGSVLVILLCGGDKGSQNRDIKKAHGLWDDYRGRK